MKKIILSIFLLCNVAAFSQFTYNMDGLSGNSVVLDSNGYDATLSFINKKFNHPDKVIQENVMDEYLLIEAFTSNGISINVLGMKNYYNVTYGVKFTFDNDTAKMELEYMYYNVDHSRVKIDLKNGKRFFKKNGEIKNTFKETPLDIETIVNNLFNDWKATLTQY